jgi:hypothetical protein
MKGAHKKLDIEKLDEIKMLCRELEELGGGLKTRLETIDVKQ